MSKYQLLIGDHLYPIGFPVVMMTAGNVMNTVRAAEHFILVFSSQGEVQYNRLRCIYNNVPDGILSDDDLLNGTLETVHAQLDLVVHQARMRLPDGQRILLPYSMRFALRDLMPAKLRSLLIQNNLGHLVEQIRHETYSDELKELLPRWPLLNRWVVEVDRELGQLPPGR